MKYELIAPKSPLDKNYPLFRFFGTSEELIKEVKELPEGVFMATDGIYKRSYEPVFTPPQEQKDE